MGVLLAQAASRGAAMGGFGNDLPAGEVGTEMHVCGRWCVRWEVGRGIARW